MKRSLKITLTVFAVLAIIVGLCCIVGQIGAHYAGNETGC